MSECILKCKNGRYILSVLVEDVWSCDTQARESVVSVDPGIRTFLTCYAGEGKVVQNSFHRVVVKIR